MQGKRFCFTLNNYTEADIARFVDAVDRLYLIIGKEVGDSGTPHLQGYITFSKNKRLAALRDICGRAHWEQAQGSTDQNIAYCSKDGDFVEYGERPKAGRRGTFKDAVDMIVAGDSIREVATENPEAYARGGRGLRDLQHILFNPYEHTGVRGYWYCGPPGTGKSHKARTENPGAYIKAQNKWWDGYSGEKVVILEDMDDPCLKHYLKLWADKWQCSGETKGGHVHLQHEKFIVTSNYTIEQLFGENEAMMQAIKRRFQVTHFNFHAFNPAIQRPPGLERPPSPIDIGLFEQAGLNDLSEDEMLQGLDYLLEEDVEEALLNEYIN